LLNNIVDFVRGERGAGKTAKLQVEHDDLDDLYQDAKEARIPMEKTWLENIAFYMGKHWLVWNKETRSFDVPSVEPWRVLITNNLIQPRIRTEYAKLIQQRPAAQVQPLSDQADDLRKARTNNHILEYSWKPTGSERAKNESLLNALIYGTGLNKIYWDPTKGKVISDPERGIFQPLGEVCVKACSPFEIYIQPLAKHIDDMDWIIHSTLRTASYIFDRYGKVVQEEEYPTDEHLEGRLSQLTDLSVSGKIKGVRTLEFWQVPCKQYPGGRYIVKVGEEVVEALPHPYKRVKLPFTAWQHIPVPSRFWGDSLPTQLADPQRNYNKSRSQGVEIRNLMSKPKIIYPLGAIPADKEITSRPGENIPYIPIAGLKPEWVSGKDIPVTFWRDLEQTRTEMNEISGQHEVTQAQVPGQVKAGVAIQQLQEQDDLRLTPASMSFEDAIASQESMKLKLMKQFYQETRVARIVGEGQRIEVVEFTADDIMDDADVVVEAGSSLPKSLSAKREFITGLVQNGILTDPRMILRLMEFDKVEELYDEINKDIAQAERENDKMRGAVQAPDPLALEQGMPAPAAPVIEAHPWDNHPIHKWAHERHMKSEEFENSDPAIQQIFIQHREMHEAFIMQAQLTAPAPAEGGGGQQPPAQAPAKLS